MIILSIETSCDETAVSLIEASGNADAPRFTVLGNALYSQAETHAEYGGVFPMLAKREHAKNLIPMFASCIENAKKHIDELGKKDKLASAALTTFTTNLPEEKVKRIRTVLEREDGLADAFLKHAEDHELPNIDAIAVTTGPGLEPALWVGVSFARALSVALDKPIIPVNHMEGHLVSVLMATSGVKEADRARQESENTASPSVQFPALALLISGGHTELVEVEGWHKYTILGSTKDDAVGEAFDKVARLLDLPYPGGPKISKLAAESRERGLAAKIEKETGKKPWAFPRPMITSPDYDFSFSGLKTSVLYAVKLITEGSKNGRPAIPATDPADPAATTQNRKLTEDEQATLAEEFENAVTEVLVEKTRKALAATHAKTLMLGGGVIANVFIRKNFENLVENAGKENMGNDTVRLFIPSIDLSTDNSVMIGIAGYLRYIADPDGSTVKPGEPLKASGNLSL